MKKGFLIKQKKEGATRDNVYTTRPHTLPCSSSKQSSSTSSSWKRGFLNSNEKKPHRTAKKKTQKKKCSLPQCTTDNNDGDDGVENIGAKIAVQSCLPISEKVHGPRNCVSSANGGELVLPSQLKEGKNEPKKKKRTSSSALLFMEETTKPARQSGILSIIDVEGDGNKARKNSAMGSNLGKNPKGIVLPLYESGDYKDEEEILLREIKTKTRGQNIVGNNIEGSFKTTESVASLNLHNVHQTRLSPAFQLQEEGYGGSDVTQKSDIRGFGDATPLRVSFHDQGQVSSKTSNRTIEESDTIIPNRVQNIDGTSSIGDYTVERKDNCNLGKTKVTTSIKMELSLLLSKLKNESKNFRASARKGGNIEKNDAKPASNKLLLSFIQKHLRSEGSSHSALTNLNLLWETVLESIALHAKEKLPLPNSTLDQAEDAHLSLPPVIWLGLSILQNCPKEGWLTLFDAALDGKDRSRNKTSSGGEVRMQVETAAVDKRRGFKTLGAALIIKLRLHFSLNRLATATLGNAKGTIDDACTEISGFEPFLVAMPCMLQNILPGFIEIIGERTGGRKRTLLSTTCMDATLLIIEYIAHIYRSALCGFFKSPIIDTIPSLLWGALPLIKQILNITQQWITNEAPMPNHDSNKLNERYGDDVEKYTDAARKQCGLAILNDWNRVISDIEHIYHKCRFIDMQDEQISQKVSMSTLCNELAGTKISRDQNEKCKYVPLSLGGIAHTLCKGVPEFRTVSVENLLEALGAASYFVESRVDSDSPNDLYHNEETIILRAVCSWFARKKHFQWTTSDSHSCSTRDYKVATQNKSQKAVQLCMTSLRSRSGRCSDLVLVILNRLWSDSNGLPADMYDITQSQVQNAGIPVSFENLLQDFDLCEYEEEDSTMLKPPQKVMCSLVERFILHKPNILLPFFLSRKQVSTMSVHVTVSILEKSVVGTTDDSNILSGDLRLLVVEKLLVLIDSNNFLQKKLLECPDILSSLAPDTTVPRLVEIIGRQVISNYTTSVVSAVLGGILQKCPECHMDGAVIAIIKGAELLDGKGKSQSNYRSFPLAKYASTWRRTILQDQPYGQKRFTKLLTTIANTMFQMPSSSYPLSLFGAFIGDGTNICNKSHVSEEKITMSNTAKVMLEMALPKINEEPEDHREQLFIRLSPLLMLRRIPFTYFRLLEINDDSDYLLLTQFAKSIALKLGIEKQNTLNVVNTPEEKRLLAEIAARCLPFSGLGIHDVSRKRELSCFERLCRPVFSKTLNSIHQGTVTRLDLEQVKCSLYIVCHFVQIAQDEDYADGLVATITFALHIVSLKNVREGDDCYDQIIQLQTGCIDFFATCLQSHCNRAATHGKEQPLRPCLIQEIDPISTQPTKTSSSLSQQSVSGKTVITCFDSLFPLLLEIICTAEVPPTSLNAQWLDSKALGSNSKEHHHFSFSARTCLLNSFSLAAQRCSIDNGSLELLASLALPPILHFSSGARTDDELRHKLCIAASLQFTFNVLTRTKSFQCLKTRSLPIAESVRQTFMLCANIIKTRSSDSDARATGLLRTTCLKLLLAITSVDQCGNDCDGDTSMHVQDCLAPGELAQMFSILRGTANIDADNSVQALAAHILTALQNKVNYR